MEEEYEVTKTKRRRLRKINEDSDEDLVEKPSLKRAKPETTILQEEDSITPVTKKRKMRVDEDDNAPAEKSGSQVIPMRESSPEKKSKLS